VVVHASPLKPRREARGFWPAGPAARGLQSERFLLGGLEILDRDEALIEHLLVLCEFGHGILRCSSRLSRGGRSRGRGGRRRGGRLLWLLKVQRLAGHAEPHAHHGHVAASALAGGLEAARDGLLQERATAIA